ncbi:MAG: hypothetical protein HQL52_13550 [Magnetococcales bacterium]|nr:hypothetical protein [Magnetococcales bacterium]
MEYLLDGLLEINDASQKDKNVKYKEIAKISSNICNLSLFYLYHQRRTSRVYRRLASWPDNNDSPRDFNDISQFANHSKLPIHSYGKTTTGYLIFDSDGEISLNSKKFLQVVADILSREFEHDFISRLFKEMTKSAPINLPKETFHERLVEIAGRAADVPFAAMRRYLKDGSKEIMECISGYSYNSNKKIDCTGLKFVRGDKLFTAFYKTMDENPPSCTVFNEDAPELMRELTSKPPFEDVKTILVAPLVVGDIKLGTVSFGFLKSIEFTEFEKDAFLAIANWTGSALSNYEETHAFAEMEKIRFNEFKSEVTNEMIQGLRHGARNNLEIANIAFDLAMEEIESADNQTKKKISGAMPDLRNCQFGILEATKDMYNMSQIAQYKELLPERCNIKDIIERSMILVRYQLSNEEIKVDERVPPNLDADIDETSFVYALVNLLLNTIDAFKRGYQKGIKKITLTANSGHDNNLGNYVEITVADNAGGVRDKKSAQLKNLNEIWNVGFSTKNDGSGMGLPYVRRVIQGQHSGDTWLSSNVHGAKFHMRFPSSRSEPKNARGRVA